jgi:hypothetical protein
MLLEKIKNIAEKKSVVINWKNNTDRKALLMANRLFLLLYLAMTLTIDCDTPRSIKNDINEKKDKVA